MLVNSPCGSCNPLWIDYLFTQVNQSEILVTVLLWFCYRLEVAVRN